ncbi:sensor histidine kinase [Actinomadura sp. 3N508]|uniref:sensor histidine kinase n=1 Tax=Actinomadura sp. 3N508 TaxID=3375153 RepID=UPI0037AC004A
MLPLVLLTVQLVAGPGLAALLDEPAGARERVLGLVAGAVVALSLCLRRERPAAVLGVAVVVGAAVDLTLPSSAGALVLWAADLIALYSLAVHRRARTAVTGGALAASAAGLVAAVRAGSPLEVPAIIVLSAVCYAAVIAFGQVRRQRVGVRRRLVERLDAAERERVLLAVAERERLARDLHDVAGHHLSAVTVHTTAALRLADRRPEMVPEALDAAVGMGREVLAALNRLVDVVARPSGTGPFEGEPSRSRPTGKLPDADLPGLLAPLCAGLVRLGVPVSVTVSGDSRALPYETAAAAYGIVQESLTNAMRHARGAPVTVRVEYRTGALVLLVCNEKGEGWNDDAELGGGRGVEGMRSRVAEAGGRLRAGPARAGGWSVHATLPTPARPRRREFGWPRLVDLMAVAMCVGLPMLAVIPPDPLIPASPLGHAALSGLLSAHALALWWRRNAPVAALAAVAGVDLLWAGLTLADVIPVSWLPALALAWTTELIAVYSLAASGPSTGAGLLGTTATGAVGGLLAATALSTDPAEQPFTAVDAVAGVVFFGVLVTLAMLPFWAWGSVVKSGRNRSSAWERSMAESVAVRTDHIVRAERSRVAAGLRDAVFEHTVRFVRAAEAALRGGPASDRRAALTLVAAEARAALAGMRELLDTMERSMDAATGARP